MEEHASWIRAYRNGDVNSLERLVEATRQPLYAYALRLTSNPHAAEEVFQETWLRAIRQFDQFKGGRFLSWLFRIAHNHVIDEVRKRRPTVSLQDPLGESDAVVGDVLASNAPGPDTLAERNDLSASIRAAADQLPHEQRQVFLMRTEADLTFREIAEVLDIPLNTALARMHYAMAKLQRNLTSEWTPP